MARNPINATPLPLQGQPLPSNWRSMAASNAKQAEAAYLDRLQNAWRNAGSMAQQNMPPMRAARLTNDSADHPHNGPKASGPKVSAIGGRQDRCDGTMKLIYDDGNGNQRWADEFGNTCWIKRGPKD
jgi:hypothetical protein